MSRQSYDAVIVGARVAGTPAATRLAEQGWKVQLLDREPPPADTLSTTRRRGGSPRSAASTGWPRWVLGADGRVSTVARLLGLEKEHRMAGEMAFILISSLFTFRRIFV